MSKAKRDWSRRRSPNHPANTNYARWRAVRLAVLTRDGFACQACGKKGSRLAVDHVLPCRDGGSRWAPDNLQTLCDGLDSCHKAKTARENSSRARFERVASNAGWYALVDELA